MSLPLLLDHLKRTSALAQVSGLLDWDQQAMMPGAGAAQRAEQASAMAAVLHGMEGDARIPDWIAGIDLTTLSATDRVNVAEAARAHARATRIPARLAEDSARAATEGQVIWQKARAENDPAPFLPALSRIVALKREEAACLAEAGQDLYDALLDQFEPGAKVAELSPLLGGLRPRLVALSDRIAGAAQHAPLTGHYPEDAQMALARDVAGRLGYDFAAGRIDRVTHPFCSGSAGDVRITTRTDEADPLNCLYSTIHETGHALYAQGIADPFLPAADYCSMGVHESQSRFWENQIARSRPFMDWLAPAMAARFGTDLGADALYGAVNRVARGFIRTEADEVHYNLHILLRFELERDLISGALDVADLEGAWNERFARDLGVAVPEPRLGLLQDVHWSAGLFGYFPTYSLGNLYAACLDRAMRADLPERDGMVRTAQTGPILDWLRRRIHRQGRLLTAPALIAAATGAAPTADPLLDYVEEKFTALYAL